MAIKVAINHRTNYNYDRLVTLSPHIIRLRPAPHCRTSVSSYALRIQPSTHFLNWQQDPHGNYLTRTVFPELTRQLTVEVDLVAELAVINPFDFFLEPSAEEFPFSYEKWLAKDLRPYLKKGRKGRRLRTFVESIDLTPRRTVDFLVEQNHRVSQHIEYVIRMEPGVQTSEQTLKLRSGSCRDSTWLLLKPYGGSDWPAGREEGADQAVCDRPGNTTRRGAPPDTPGSTVRPPLPRAPRPTCSGVRSSLRDTHTRTSGRLASSAAPP